MNAADFVSRLGAKGRPRKVLSGWQCCCPAHADKSPSLSVSDAPDGKVLIRCFAGCTTDAVCAAVGLTVKDLFPPRDATVTAPLARPVAVARESFDWQSCVAAFTDANAQKLTEWRGLSIEFVRWLHAQGVVGIFEGKLAFANHGDGGNVVSCHVRLDNGKWIYKPSGQKTAPLVFGDTLRAGYVMAFESQWDAFAVMDQFGWHTDDGLQDAAVLITRGAANGKLIAGRCSTDTVCYAFKQNDAPTPEKPTPAGDIWLAEVAAHCGCKCRHVITPAPHADANDWTRAGATKADIQSAIAAAKICEPPAQAEAITSSNSSASEYVAGADEHEATGERLLPDILDAADFIAAPIAPPAELVAGILHRGSKLAFGGSSKSFKTWNLLDLALSVSTGSDWLGRSTAQGKVLFVNFEIQPHPWQKRIAAVADAKGIKLQAGQVHLWNLRSHAADFRKIIPRMIERARTENYALIILDPIYKLYGGTDENAAGDVAALLNALESLAMETGAAIAFGAHFAKGNAAGKEAVDRISGSGVFARDPDSLLIFTKHEADDAFTVEPILRNFAPVEPFAVRWEFPLMRRADDLDPSKLKQAGGRKPIYSPADLLAMLPSAGLANADWLAKADGEGMSKPTFYRLRKTLQSSGKIHVSVVSGTWQPILTK